MEDIKPTTETISDAKQETAVSSPAGGANTETSPTQADANKGDFADQAIAAMVEKAKEKSPSESSPEKTAETQEEKPAGEISNPNPTEAKGEFDDLPFHKHERFQQLVKERGEYKKQIEDQKESLDWLSNHDKFCQSHGITGEQFKNLMEIQALINTNPTEAHKRIQPLVEYLGQFTGSKLPEDLQKKVESGTIDMESAQELAAARQRSKFAEQRQQHTAITSRNQVLANTLSSWETQIQTRDPDFARKQQFVVDRFVALSARSPWQTPEQIYALAEQAYKDVNEMIGGFIPKPKPTSKTLSTNGKSGGQPEEPKNWDDVPEYIAAKYSGSRR